MKKIDISKVSVIEFNNTNTIKFDISKFLDIDHAIYDVITKVYNPLKDDGMKLSFVGFCLSYLNPKLCWYMSIANYINKRFIKNSKKIYNSLMINVDNNYALLEYINGSGNIEKLPIKFNNFEVDVLSGVYAYMNYYYNNNLENDERKKINFKQFSELMVVVMFKHDVERAVKNPFFRFKYLFLNSIRIRRYA